MTATDDAGRTGGGARGRRARLAHRLFVVRELGIVLALVLLVAVTVAVNPRFLSAQSVKDLLLGSTILAILAVGQAIVIITRNVDLSVGSMLGLSAFATGSLFVARAGHADPARHPRSGSALGAACGAVNGGADRRGPGAGAGGHARHAVRVPRPRLHLGHRPADQRRRHAARVPAPGHRDRARRAGAGPVRGRRAGRRRVLPALVPQRPGAVRDRLRPGRGEAVRHPGRPAGVRRVRRQRRARRARRRAATPPASAPSTPTPALGLRAQRRGRGRRRRRGHLRRQRLGLRRRARAPCCSPRSAARCRCSASTRSGSAPPSAR